MTLQEMTKILSKTALFHCGIGDITIPVVIKDIRKVYDRVDCLITPVSGSGETWVSLRRLTLSEEG